MPRLCPLLGRLVPKRREEKLLHVDEPALAVRDLGAKLFGPLVQAHGIGQAVGADLGLEPLLDGLVDDEEQ